MGACVHFSWVYTLLLGVQAELLDHMVTMVNLGGTAGLFPKAKAPIYISAGMKSSMLTTNKVIYTFVTYLRAKKFHTT